MLNSNIISTPAPPLQLSDGIEFAQALFDDLKIHHWPVVEDKIFKGMVTEESLLDAGESKIIKDIQSELLTYKITSNEHYLEALGVMTDRRLDVITVTNSAGEYLGVILTKDILHQLGNFLGVHQPGGLIVMETDIIHFSAGEINRLVETNDAQIIQFNTQIDESTGRLLVTIRINKQEVSDIVATLQRYEYQITYFAGEEQYQNELKRNFNHLLHFIEM
jgi:CBS domain-containing protein